VFYRLTDHLGSSSTLVTQAAVVSGARNYYYPYGENRGGAAFNGLTAKRFTGQYHEAALPGGEGLSDCEALVVVHGRPRSSRIFSPAS
jgi:hypothetical protein